MSQRRSAAVLAATVLCTAVAPLALPGTASAAPTADASAASDDGLYGKGDPKYDGVWRQSVALLAQDTAGVTPAGEADAWLAEQQCADGSFAAYRPEAGEKCGKKTVADTNATAAAVQALSALGGHADVVKSAVKWLKSVQNEDGGWGYNPGTPTDANSVAVVIGALTAAGEDPAKSGKGGASPYDALLGLQLGCDAKESERGGFAYQPGEKGGLAPNTDSTAAAALAAQGEGMSVEPAGADDDEPAAPLKCGGGGGDAKDAGKTPSPEDAASAGAAYLTAALKKNGQHLPSAVTGAEDQPDYGNTADAVIALAAGEHGDAARAALGWLEKNAKRWEKFAADPAALGSLVLATHAAGGDARDFGGTDLVKRLNATGPKPEKVTDPKDTEEAGEEDDGGSDNTVVTVSLVAAGLAAGAGIGFLLSGRRRRQGL